VDRRGEDNSCKDSDIKGGTDDNFCESNIDSCVGFEIVVIAFAPPDFRLVHRIPDNNLNIPAFSMLPRLLPTQSEGCIPDDSEGRTVIYQGQV
jgi:hypothetical protein